MAGQAYDDFPDADVHVVLSVPLSVPLSRPLSRPLAAPVREPVRAEPGRARGRPARHRRWSPGLQAAAEPTAQVDAADAPNPGRHRAATTQQLGGNEAATTVLPVTSAARETVSVGITAAAVVFVALAGFLVLANWLWG